MTNLQESMGSALTHVRNAQTALSVGDEGSAKSAMALTEQVLINVFESTLISENFEPEVGQWCWFWKYEETDTPDLGRFDGKNKYGELTTKEYGDNEYYHCEPFTGDLPSIVKKRLGL